MLYYSLLSSKKVILYVAFFIDCLASLIKGPDHFMDDFIKIKIASVAVYIRFKFEAKIKCHPATFLPHCSPLKENINSNMKPAKMQSKTNGREFPLRIQVIQQKGVR